MGWGSELWEKIRFLLPSAFAKKPTTGQLGEQIARGYLKSCGYQVLDRNFRRPDGEIDIIAVKEGLLVFVEVKTLRDPKRRPQDAVGKQKQRKIIKTARFYLSQKNLTDQKHRFDIIAVTLEEEKQPKVQHFPGAFSP